MPGLTCLRCSMRHALLLSLAVLGIVVLSALAAAPAHAAGCENSWAKASSGSWSKAENWSKKAVPAAGEEVCITEPGTYTVELNGINISLKALTVGGTSGVQTLSVASTCSVNEVLTTTAGLIINTTGAVALTNVETCGDSSEIVGTISNAGTLSSEKAIGGARTLQGNLTNTGTVNINANTSYNASKAALANQGTLNVASGVALSVSEEGSFTNGTGGKIAATGTGDVGLGSKTSFKEGAGTTSGTLPVIVDDGSLAYEGSGESTIAQRGEGSTLSGSSSAKQTLLVQSTCGENTKDTAAGGFSNGGQLTLTNADTCGDTATLVGAITNTGTITSEKAIGGARSLQGSLINKGTLSVGIATSFNGTAATLTNEGAITVAEGVRLTVSGASTVINGTGGSIAGGSTGNVFIESSGAYKQGAGTTSGTQPVIVDDAAITYEGSGESTVAARGEKTTLSGNIGAKQTLIVESTCGENAKTTAAGSFSNAGQIEITNAETCGNGATLLVPIGSTLSNSGTISSESAIGGARHIEGSVTNTGTLNVNRATGDEEAGETFTNEGNVNVAAGVLLTLGGGATVNNNGGTIAGGTTGEVSVTSGTFNEGLGKATGTLPVVLDDSALHYTGKGASTIALRGEGSSLSGTINAGQTLSIQSTCSENTAVPAVGFLNSGTIVMTNGDTCGNNATLKLGGGTLVNKGTIKIEEPHGGARTIEGSLTQEKTLQVNAAATLKLTGALTQTKLGTLKIGINSASSFGVVAVTGAATITGSKLTLTQLKGFFATLGQHYAVLTSSALTGTFTKETGGTIKPKGVIGLYYLPTYSSTTATLVVEQAAVVDVPAEGLPGAKVKLSGTHWPPGDTVKLSFTDVKKVKTTYANATVNGAGEFSAEEEIPATAAEGLGKFTVTSTLTGLAVSENFKVT